MKYIRLFLLIVILSGCYPTEIRQSNEMVSVEEVHEDYYWSEQLSSSVSVDANIDFLETPLITQKVQWKQLDIDDFKNIIDEDQFHLSSSEMYTDKYGRYLYESAQNDSLFIDVDSFIFQDNAKIGGKDFGILLSAFNYSMFDTQFFSEHPSIELEHLSLSDAKKTFQEMIRGMEGWIGLEPKLATLSKEKLIEYNQVTIERMLKTDFAPFTEEDETYVFVSNLAFNQIPLYPYAYEYELGRGYNGSKVVSLIDEDGVFYVSGSGTYEPVAATENTNRIMGVEAIKKRIIDEYIENTEYANVNIQKIQLYYLPLLVDSEDVIFEMHPIWAVYSEVSTFKDGEENISITELIFSAIDGRRL